MVLDRIITVITIIIKKKQNVRISFGKLMAMVCTMTVFYTLLSLAHSFYHLAQWLTISNFDYGVVVGGPFTIATLHVPFIW